MESAIASLRHPVPHLETVIGSVLFDSAFESFYSDDVLTARSCALIILAGSDAPAGLLANARLVLTAACLHVHARVGPDPTLCELRDFLVSLKVDSTGFATLAASPIQFVRYAAAELADAYSVFGPAVDEAVRALTKRTKTITKLLQALKQMK